MAVQAENMADDVDILPEMRYWSRQEVEQYFESGGEERPDMTMVEEHVSVPRASGGLPLSGWLLWPSDVSEDFCDQITLKPAFGIVFNPANPAERLGAYHMDSTLPLALVAACKAARLPLLRYDYSHVRGSGGSSDYEELYGGANSTMHPNAADECADAARFMQDRCSRIVVCGMSLGAAVMPHKACAKADVFISVSTAPDFVKMFPESQREEFRRQDEAHYTKLAAGMPKLFIVGTRDRFAPKPAMERLLSLTPAPATLHWVEGAKHDLEGFEPAVAQLAVDFVVAHWQELCTGKG